MFVVLSVNEYQYKNIRIKAISSGGVENCFLLPDYHIAFDIGRSPEEFISANKIFISHGHLDHAAGLPYYFSQRSLKNMKSAVVYVPEKIEKPLTQILELWQEIEKFKYPKQLVAFNKDDTTSISKEIFIKAIQSYHRVPSLGYVLYRKVTKLKQRYLSLSGKQIEKLKRQNKDIFNEQVQSLFCYSGDTDIRFIQKNESVQNAKVLLLECTYIDDKKTSANAKKWGHIHLDDIIENEHLFKNEKIYLFHFSRRYSKKYILSILEMKLPDSLKERIEIIVDHF